MNRDRRHDWDAPDNIEDGHLDSDSSSPDDFANETNFVPTSSGYPVKVLSPAEKGKT